MIFIFGVICLSMIFSGPVSAATIYINDSSSYDTSMVSLNEQIQDIIDASSAGDTIEFIGNYYENLSLVVNHSLNIISQVKTMISGSSNPIFLINSSGSFGTNITGFNLEMKNGDSIIINNTSNILISSNNISAVNGTGINITGCSGANIKNNKINNSKTGISIDDSRNIMVTGNSIKNNVNNGVNVKKTQNSVINKNQISSNGNNGVSITDSKNITIEDNSIDKNGNNGVTLKNSNKTSINGNNINENQGSGIYFDGNVKDTQIKRNNINYNKYSGIALAKSGANTNINGNNITGNVIGININCSSDNLVITQNMITNSIKQVDDDSGTSGVGINFGSNYGSSSTFKVNYNAIYGNQRREVEIRDTSDTVIFGANWYGHSLLSGCNFCPKLQTRLITVKLIQSKSGVYRAVFYDGDTVASLLPSFDVTFKLNNGNLQIATVINGIATSTFSKSLYASGGNVVSVRTTYQTQSLNLSEDDLKRILNSDGSSSGSGGDGAGSGTGSGSGQGSGSGTGGTSASGSFQGSGSLSLGTTDLSGDHGGSPGSSTDSGGSSGDEEKQKSAQEVFLDETTKNPQIKSIIGLIVIVVIILIAYYRKDLIKLVRK